MNEFLIELARLCDRYDVCLRTCNGIDFESFAGDEYISNEAINNMVILKHLKGLD